MNGLENPEIHSIGIPLAETCLQGPNRSDHSDDESESISFSSHTVKNYEPGDLKSLLTVTDTERSPQDNGQTGSSTGNTPEQSSPKPGLIDQKRKGHGRSVPTKRIDRLCRQMALASKNVSPSRNKRRSSALGLGSEAKRQVKRSRDPFYDEILEQYEPRLYEVLPLPHPEAAGPRFRPTKTATGNKHEPLWMFPKVIKFDVCRPYQHASADLYVVNQSSEPVPFQLSILGDPRLNREFSPGAMIPRVPTHTEILQEKPYFQQANMHFDPAIYTVGPVLGKVIKRPSSLRRDFITHQVNFRAGKTAAPRSVASQLRDPPQRGQLCRFKHDSPRSNLFRGFHRESFRDSKIPTSYLQFFLGPPLFRTPEPVGNRPHRRTIPSMVCHNCTRPADDSQHQ